MSTKKEREEKLAKAREGGEEGGSDDIPEVREAATPAEDEVVTLDDESGGGDDETQESAKPSRQEKKQSRFKQNQEERDHFASMYEQERATSQRLLSHLEKLTTPRDAAPPAVSDPLDARLQSVRDQLDAIGMQADALGDRMTREQAEDLKKRARALREQEAELIVERAEKKRGGAREAGSMPSPDQILHRARLQDLREEFEDIYSHDPMRNQSYPALQWAQGRYYQLKSQANVSGESMKLIKQAFREAEEQFGFRKRAISDGQRAKYAAAGRGTGGSGGDDRRVVLSPAAQRLRNVQFSHIKDPHKRKQAMARAVKKARDRRAEG